MSVLTRPQWSPPRLPCDLQVELSPLSASSAGSPGALGEEEAAYGGSLIMVQHMVEHTTEQAAEAEDEERLCSVVLDPLPNSLLQSLSAQGHVRMHRPPAAQPISAQGHETMVEPPPTQPIDSQEPERMLRPPAAATWPLHDVPPETAFLPAEAHHHHHHRKKSRKARRESHDSERSHKKRKRSTSSSSGCEPESARVNPIFVWVTQTESTITQVMCEDYDKRNRIRLTKTPNGWRAIPRTNLQPAIQSEPAVESEGLSSDDTLDLSAKKYHATNHESGLFDSEDEDNHVPNLEEECKQEHVDQQNKMFDIEGDDNVEYNASEESKEQVNEESGMFGLEEDEENMSNVEETPDQSELLMSELEAVAPENSEEFACDMENVAPETTDYVPDLETVLAENIEMIEEDQRELVSDRSAEEQDENYSHFEDENMIDNFVDEIASNMDNKEVEDEAQNLSVLDAEVNQEQSERCDMAESHEEKKIEGKENLALEVKKKDFDEFDFDCGLKCDEVKDEKKVFTEPPPAHAASIPVKLEEDTTVEPPADLSCKRKRRLSGILPCRSVLRLPPLVARSYTSPVPLPPQERGSPSPAHNQVPYLPPADTPTCGEQSPPHAHQQRAATTNLLEGLLSQQPLALDTAAKRPAVSKESTPKRRKCEDVTLRSLLKVTQETTPPSRLLELLTTSAPSQKHSAISPSAVPQIPSVSLPPVGSRKSQVTQPGSIRRPSATSPLVSHRRASVTSPPAVKPPRTPTQATSPPLDALAQLRLVLQEVAVPDPLLVPRSRLAALLANPATEIPRLVRSPPPTTPDTLAVSLSRLHALLKRPDSELLAWAARDWAKPAAKLSVPKPPAKPTLPWWLPNKAVPPPPSPDILAAIHAMYGPTLMQPQYFAPHFPAWSVPTPPTQPPVNSQQPTAKPRIACKSLVELLAKKPEEPPALNLVRAPAKPQRKEVHRPSPPEKDSSCPRLWHPLFGSQKCDSWNWRPVSVRGE